MKTSFTFTPKRLNTTRKWYAAVEKTGEKVSLEAFNRELMAANHFDRQTFQRFKSLLQIYLIEELLQGNSVNLFGIVRIAPYFQVTRRAVKSEAEARALISQLTDSDVRTSVSAHATLFFSRLFAFHARHHNTALVHPAGR